MARIARAPAELLTNPYVKRLFDQYRGSKYVRRIAS